MYKRLAPFNEDYLILSNILRSEFPDMTSNALIITTPNLYFVSKSVSFAVDLIFESNEVFVVEYNYFTF